MSNILKSLENFDQLSLEDESVTTKGRIHKPQALQFTFKKGKKSASSSKAVAEATFVEQAQHYFESASSDRPIHISASTLEAVERPMIDSQKFMQISKQLKDPHQDHIDDLLVDYEVRFFEKWLLLMESGFNILIQGYGSKINLIENFRLLHLMDYHHVVIKGYYPGLTLKSIMDSLSDAIGFTNEHPPTSWEKFCEDFLEYFSQQKIRLYIMIVSIDAALTNLNKLLSFLKSLTSQTRIRFVASIDLINANLLWDQESKNCFRWLTYNCSTFENYSIESSFENGFLHNPSGSLALSSLMNVVKSLTPNAKKILEVIMTNHLQTAAKSKGAATPSGILFQRCYLMCRESFLVNSDLALRGQLTEFVDHGLITIKKNSEGGEIIVLNLSQSVMNTYLGNKDS